MPSHIVIIGAGPAGEAAATTLRRLDKSVRITVIEKEHAGGLCLNKGCVPSKSLLESVRRLKETGQPIPWAEIQREKTRLVTSIRSLMEARFKRENIILLQGQAKFVSSASLSVQTNTGSQTIEFDSAIIATGTQHYIPSVFTSIQDQLLTSDTALETSTTPRSVLIVGGGAIGCEFACLLHAAGAEVTMIEMKPGLLPGEDEAVASALQQSFEKRGMKIFTNTVVESLTKNPAGWTVNFSDKQSASFEKILLCVGRIPDFQSLNLDAGGVKAANTITVDNHLFTSNPRILAAGDVTGSRLAHHATVLGEIAAQNALGNLQKQSDDLIPRCLYSWPEVASVGHPKTHWENLGKTPKVTRAFFKGSAKAQASGEADGFVQLVSDSNSGKILGAQIIGPHATELIHIFSVAMKAQFTTQQLAEVTFAHPTLSETIKDAARK